MSDEEIDSEDEGYIPADFEDVECDRDAEGDDVPRRRGADFLHIEKRYTSVAK